MYTKPYTSEGYINEFLNPNDKALSKERKQYVIINALKFIAFK